MKKKALALLLGVAAALSVTACQANGAAALPAPSPPETAPGQSVPADGGDEDTALEVCEVEALGFRLKFPARWKGNYAIVPHPNAQDTDRLQCRDIKTPWDTYLCVLERWTKAAWEEETENSVLSEDELPFDRKIIGQSDAYVYRMVFAGDPGNPSEEELVTEQAMREDLHGGQFEFEIME